MPRGMGNFWVFRLFFRWCRNSARPVGFIPLGRSSASRQRHIQRVRRHNGLSFHRVGEQ